MKDHIRVSLVQFAPEWLERQKNAERMKVFAETEAEDGAELIVFPELANIGYITPVVRGALPTFDSKTSATDFAVKYITNAEPIPGPTTEVLGNVARKWGVYIVVGICQLHPVIPATLYNSAALIGPSGVIGVYHKMHLPFMEKTYFYPGSTAQVYSTDLGNIGMAVCYDNSRFPELIRIQALQGAEIICAVWSVPWATEEVFSGPDCLKHIAYTRAVENGVYYLACNRSGKEGDTTFRGHSVVASPKGELVACSESEEEEVLTADLYNEQLVRFRSQITIFQDRRPELYLPLIEPLSQPHHPAATSKVVTEPATVQHQEVSQKDIQA